MMAALPQRCRARLAPPYRNDSLINQSYSTISIAENFNIYHTGLTEALRK